MNVEEIQRRLWEQSKIHRENREASCPLFPTNVYDNRIRNLSDLIHQPDWLNEAASRVCVRSRGKAPGVDGMTVSEFTKHGIEHVQNFRQELKKQTYRPQPLRRVEIPKANGKMRSLGIPCLRDKIVQESMRMALEPIFEVEFHQNSYGFRPHRSTHHAVFQCQQAMLQGFTWIIEGDVKACFDEISHKVILGAIQEKVIDNKFLDLSQLFLKVYRKFYFNRRIGVSHNRTLVRFSDTKISLAFRKPVEYEPGKGTYLEDHIWEADFRCPDKDRPGQRDLKQKALERDCHQCCECGYSVDSESSQLDHIKPVHKFASFEQAHTLDNVQTLCVNCHEQKSRLERKN